MRLRRHSRLGSTAVEFALAWPLMFLLFSGVYQFGYSFYVYDALMTSVADAAMLGSKMDYDTANPSAFSTALQNMVVYGDTTPGARPVVLGLTTSNVNVVVNTSGSIPLDVTVSINNFTIDTIFTKFALRGKPRATTAYLGHVKCSTC